MELDVLHLISRLGQIDSFGDTGDHLVNIVKSKQSKLAAAKSEKTDSESKKVEADSPAGEDAQKAPSDNSNNS